MFLEAKCPCCGKEIVLEVDVFDRSTLQTARGILAYVKGGFEKNEFIEERKQQLLKTLPIHKQEVGSYFLNLSAETKNLVYMKLEKEGVKEINNVLYPKDWKP